MSLSYSNVKTLKPIRGIREAIIDVTLDGSYVAGGWSITASALTNYSGIGNVIYNLIPPATKGGYFFEWVPVSGNASGKLKAVGGAVSDEFTLAAIAEYTKYPATTSTEQAAGYAKVYDASAGTYLPLSTCSSAPTYTANYQLFPDTPVALLDYAIFGAAVPFSQIAFDVDTAATYDAASVIGWNYWNGTTWADLDASIVYDGSGSTGTTGDYAFEQDGTMTFIPPQDWAASTIDSQSAYWIKCSIETGKVANMTQAPILVSEHDLLVVDTGWVSTRAGLVTSVTLNDGAATLHTANDIKFIVVNQTTGESSGECSFAQDLRSQTIELPYSVTTSVGDKMAIVCTQEDGTNEFAAGKISFNYVAGEAQASDPALNGLVLRCKVVGS